MGSTIHSVSAALLAALLCALTGVRPAAAHAVRSTHAHHRLHVGEGNLDRNETSLARLPDELHLSAFEGVLDRVSADVTALAGDVPLLLSHAAGRSQTTAAGVAPPRGAALKPLEDEQKGGSQGIFDGRWKIGAFQCNQPHTITAESDKWVKCPEECPLFAKYKGDDVFCNFACVTATVASCQMLNPKEPIVDLERGICRDCWVGGCEQCAMDGTDTCLKCAPGFSLSKEGGCDNQYFAGWVALFLVLFICVALVGLWMFDLWRRPITNTEGLKWGLAQRSRAKLHMPRAKEAAFGGSEGDDGGSSARRSLWPLTTNLLRTQVAGPGILLQFNFQFVIILWGALVALAWYMMAVNTHTELLELGRHAAETPRQNCIVVAFGYEMQQSLMYAKIDFTLGLYIGSFILALLHGVRQLRMFQSMDADNTTHKDFAARCFGLPILKGDVKVEEELKERMADATKQVVVGVSVSYDYKAKEEDVLQTLEEYLKERETGKPLAKSVQDALRESQEKEEAEHQKAKEAKEHEHAEHPHEETRLERLESRAEAAAEAFQRKSGYVFRKMESLFMHPATQKMLTRGGVKIRKKFHEEEEDGMVSKAASKAAEAVKGHAAGAARAIRDRTPRGCCGSRERPANEEEEQEEEVDEEAAEEEEEEEEFDAEQAILEMETTHEAFVVFESEPARDAAIEAFNAKGDVEYRGNKIYLEAAACEPDTVLWPNLAVDDFQEKLIRGVLGIGAIGVALVVWAVTFYLPYAYFVVFASSFEHGQDPDPISGITFSMVVVLGNVLMYLVCSEVADRIGLHYVDDREVVYMLLYAFACVCNVALDLVTTYVMAYEMMVGRDMRTYQGVHLRDIETFTGRFETYAMQRALGEQLMAYSWPSTFFVPFVLEPVGTIWAPYKIMTLLIRSHSDVTPDEAEGYLGSLVMDLSRYADLMLNIMLAVLVFFFPGGFVVPMFAAFAFSHCWIYLVDHYRVIKVVRKCNYAAMSVDWWAQWMLCMPLGFLASCLVFKANCQTGYLGMEREPPFCMEGAKLLGSMGLAFVAHVALHTLLLVSVVPLLGKEEVPPTTDTYQDCAEGLACSWFTANPIYCLRSKFIYEHDPPCDFCLAGKEHLIRKNEEIGQFFQDEQAEVEDFASSEAMPAQMLHDFRRSSSRILGFRRASDVSEPESVDPPKESKA